MTLSVRHGFTSPVADDSDPAKVQPSHWNAEHVISSAAKRLVGNPATSAGVVAEIAIGAGLELTDAGVLNVALALPVGALIDYFGAAAPAGWLFAAGETIGNAFSGATYAGAEYEALFTHLNAMAGGGAIFANDDVVTLPDARGRVLVGLDGMGALAAAERVTTAGSGLDGATLGASGGAQTHTLTTGEMPAHTHPATHVGGTIEDDDPFFAESFARGAGAPGAQTGSAGGGQAHNNMPPALIVTKLIKY